MPSRDVTRPTSALCITGQVRALPIAHANWKAGVLFALLERQGAKLAPPKLPKRAKEKGKAKEKAEPPTAAESAAALEYIASLHELVAVFAALVDFTRQHEGKATLVVSVLKHSAGFLKMINVKALPVMSAHFKEAYQECQALLKAAQPASSEARRLQSSGE